MAYLDLNIREKAALIRMGVANGLNSISSIKDTYNLLSEDTNLFLNGGTYTVQKGQTLSSIARSLGVSIAELISANPKLNPDKLSIGLVLTLPKKESKVTAQTKVAGNVKTPSKSQIVSTAWVNENPFNKGLNKDGTYRKYKDPNGKGYNVGPGLLVGTTIKDKAKYSKSELDAAAYKFGLEGLSAIGEHYNLKYGTEEFPTPWDTVSIAPKLLMLDTRYQNGRLPISGWPSLYLAVADGNWGEALRQSRSQYDKAGVTHYDNDRVRRRSESLFPGMYNVSFIEDNILLPIVTPIKKKSHGGHLFDGTSEPSQLMKTIGYIGGTPEEARYKYLQADTRLLGAMQKLAKDYNIPFDAFLNRLSREGIIDKAIKEHNSKFKQEGYAFPSLLDRENTGRRTFEDFGLDYSFDNYDKYKLLRPIAATRQENINEKGQKTHSANVRSVYDILELKAADLAYRAKRLQEKGITPTSALVSASYNRGLGNINSSNADSLEKVYAIPATIQNLAGREYNTENINSAQDLSLFGDYGFDSGMRAAAMGYIPYKTPQLYGENILSTQTRNGTPLDSLDFRNMFEEGFKYEDEERKANNVTSSKENIIKELTSGFSKFAPAYIHSTGGPLYPFSFSKQPLPQVRM